MPLHYNPSALAALGHLPLHKGGFFIPAASVTHLKWKPESSTFIAEKTSI